MKKICFLILCLYFIVYPASTQEITDATLQKSANPIVQEYLSNTQDAYYNDNVTEQYGCEQSPAFLNRENINPNEDSYGYGGSDGIGSDSYDDYPYTFE